MFDQNNRVQSRLKMSLFFKEMDDYIKEAAEKNPDEIDILLDKLADAYHSLIDQINQLNRRWYLLFFLYLGLKIFEITKIDVLGITVNQSSIFSSVFLIIASYFLFREFSMGIHKRHIFYLYSILTSRSKRIFYKYMFHYYLIPNNIGLTEEIHEKKFQRRNNFYFIVETVSMLLTYCSVLVLYITSFTDTLNFHNHNLKTFHIVIFFFTLAVVVSVSFIVITIINVFNFLKIYEYK